MAAAVVAAMVVGGGACGVCQADVYSFVDDHGVMHFTNVPTDSRFQLLHRAPRDSRGASAVRGLGKRYAALVAKAARDHNLDQALLRAVIAVESGYNPRAVSHKGAVGLMQLMPGTAQRYGATDPFDPAQNVHAGARYLRDLMSRFDDDVSLALAAYNAGEGAVVAHGNRIPPYRETRNYVSRVIDLYRKTGPAPP